MVTNGSFVSFVFSRDLFLLFFKYHLAVVWEVATTVYCTATGTGTGTGTGPGTGTGTGTGTGPGTGTGTGLSRRCASSCASHMAGKAARAVPADGGHNLYTKLPCS